MKPQPTPEQGTTTEPNHKLLVNLIPPKLIHYNKYTTRTSPTECVPENQNQTQNQNNDVPEDQNQDKKTKKEEPDLTTPKTETRMEKKTLPELKRKPLSEPDQKPNKGTKQKPKQRNKVTDKVVKTNDLKLFLARKKLERESKLKPKMTKFTPPHETSPSNSSVSATLSPPPENSLPQSAPRADDQKPAMFFKKFNWDQTSSASNEGYQRCVASSDWLNVCNKSG